MDAKLYAEQLFLTIPILGMPVPGNRTGGVFWTGTPFIGGAATGVPTQDDLRASPFFVPVQTNFDRIAAEVTVAVAATTVRLGVYADDGRGLPGALLLDAGTINGNSATVQAITINLNLSPGRYWLCAVSQGGAPTLRVNGTGGGIPGLPEGFGATWVPSAALTGFGMSPVAGALPATFVAATTPGAMPRVGLRIA